MVRLLLLNHNVAWSGGTFFRAYHFGRFLAKRGHDVTLLTVSPSQRVRMVERVRDGVRVIETPDLCWGSARSGWDPWDTLRRMMFARGRSYDLVHAFDSRLAVILPALAVQRRGVPLVIDWADWWGRGGTIDERHAGRRLRAVIRPVETFFEERFRTRANATTVISHALERRVLDLGVPADSIARIPQGCDVDAVQPRDSRACRNALGVPDGPLLGYLGVLPGSDARLLFDTFARLSRMRPGTRLVMIGRHKAVVPPLEGIVETGFVALDQMVTWLGACDLLLLPLKNTVASRGRWPSKLNDYLAAGRAVVGTEVGEVAELFSRCDVGRLAPDDAGALAQAIIDLLDHPAERERLGANARRLAEEELSWPLLAARMDRHYERTLG